MLSMVCRSFPVFAAILVTLSTLAAHAEDSSLAAFFGKYEGVGITREPDVTHYEIGLRDLDVEIGAEGDGFYVRWTTVIHDVDKPEPRRRSAQASFVPSDRPGIYVERNGAAGISSGLSWAVVSHKTLSVRILAIRDDGGYEIQAYHRRIEEAEMWPQFISDRNGQAIRTVNARLRRAAE